MATKFKKFLKSFTLIELIIVIAIIAVLGASAFLLLSHWMSKGRDSRRLTDLRTLEKTIHISFVAKEGVNYPDPDPKIGVTIGTGVDAYGILWYQGKFGEKMTDYVGNLNKIPKDPKGNYYDYSLTEDKKYYQLLAIMENDKQVSLGIGKVYGEELERTYILTNYEGYIVKKIGEDKYYLIKTETIIVDPLKLEDYNEDEYEIDIKNDLLKSDSPYSERVEVLTGDVSSFFDEDTSNDGNGLKVINEVFPELKDTVIVNDLVQAVGGGINTSATIYEDCDAHEYEGYNFNLLQNRQTQTKTKVLNITDGTKTSQLSVTCDNGVVIYGEEQVNIECINDKVLNNGSCVADVCQGTMPANAEQNGTQGVTGSWGYSETLGLCKFKCNEGYNYQGGTCVENNCSAETKTIDTHIFNVGAMNHGIKQTINSTPEIITDGTITYNQEFECNKGEIQVVGLVGTNIPTCEVGHSPSGTSCTINTHTVSGSFGAGGNGATISVCGSNVTAASDGTFTTTRNYGSTCNNITATRSGYVCSTTTQGPLSLISNTTNIAGTCSAIVNGSCGTSNGDATNVAPSTNLCSAGTASTVTTNTGTYTWTCNGNNTGTDASCSAPRQYTVTFNGNGGTVGTASKIVTYYTAVGTLSTATRSGYTLNGWYTAASGGTQITTATVITTNITYYAQWTINTYTVSGSFGALANGATISVCGSNVTADASGNFTITKNYGTVCNNISATRTGYTCNTTTNGPVSLNSNFTTVAGNCVANTRESGTWGTCSNTCGSGTQSRSVVCKNPSGTTIADSNCLGIKPIISQSCTSTSGCTYSFTYGNWSACSAVSYWGARGGCSVTCGGGIQYSYCSQPAGTQTRTATCLRSDGTTVVNSYCGTPTLSQACTASLAGCGGLASRSLGCNTHSCPVSVTFYVSADNRGEMWLSNSSLVKGASLGGSWGTSGQYKITHGPHYLTFTPGVPVYFYSEGFNEDSYGGPSFIFSNVHPSKFIVTIHSLVAGTSPSYYTTEARSYNPALGNRGRLRFSGSNTTWKWYFSLTYTG